MYPKSDLLKLNRRREAQRRISFARKRLWETVAELQLARGKITSLPREMCMPPEWALRSARLASDRWLAPTAKLTPEAIRNDPRGALKEIMGLFDAMIACANQLPENLPEEERSKPEIKAIGHLAAKLAASRFLAHLKRLERALNEKLPTPSHKELVAHARSYERGLTEMFSPDGDVVGSRTLTAQIYYLVWFFWPKLSQRKQLRAVDLQKFFSDEIGQQFGIKLVEAVYRDVGLARRDSSKG